MTHGIRPYWLNFIDGTWADGEDPSRITVTDPASAQPIADVARALPADVDRAVAAARRCFGHDAGAALAAGQVYVNEWWAGGVETPFGGMKRSGYGCEKGQEALLGYVETKNVGIRL